MDLDNKDKEIKATIFFDKDSKGAVERKARKKGMPTPAFIGASWASLFVGILAYGIGLYNATMELNEKGYYSAILLLGLFSAVSLQKSVRDKEEDIPVTSIYYGICWVALLSAIGLMGVGLWNAGSIVRSEKGFYAMAFVLSLFASVTVQKNIRDTKEVESDND